jgi:hypothetical protein
MPRAAPARRSLKATNVDIAIDAILRFRHRTQHSTKWFSNAPPVSRLLLFVPLRKPDPANRFPDAFLYYPCLIRVSSVAETPMLFSLDSIQLALIRRPIPRATPYRRN